MGLLAQLHANLTAPQLDITLGDRELFKANLKITLGNYKPAMALMAATTDHNQRSFRAETLAQWEGRPEAFDKWLAEHPEDPNANLVSAEHLINWAWEARGRGAGSGVSQEAAQLFVERLTLATRHIQQAVELAPGDPAPIAAAITIAKGLNQPKGEIAELFNRAIQIEPDHHAAHYAMTDYLCAKWHGSHEEMFTLARNAAGNAAPGSSLHGLVAVAHIERWANPGSDESEDRTGANYWKQSPVKDELRAAAEAFLSPGAELTPYQCVAGNHFAVALTFAKEFDAAHRVFQALGNRVTKSPWRRIGDPGSCYSLWRRDVRKQCK